VGWMNVDGMHRGGRWSGGILLVRAGQARHRGTGQRGTRQQALWPSKEWVRPPQKVHSNSGTGGPTGERDEGLAGAVSPENCSGAT
jgi:hypothetical protein